MPLFKKYSDPLFSYFYEVMMASFLFYIRFPYMFIYVFQNFNFALLGQIFCLYNYNTVHLGVRL